MLVTSRAGLWSGIKNLYYDIREKQRIVETEFLNNKEYERLKGEVEKLEKYAGRAIKKAEKARVKLLEHRDKMGLPKIEFEEL